MRKFALLGAIGILWLFVAAIPAFADGGPHVMATNNGTAGLTADSCAGCHRAHTATAASLLNSQQPDLCLNCHDGSKATTDVVDGVQYSGTAKTTPVLGALRGGGFQYALIDSSNAARASYQANHGSGPVTGFIGHVQALTTAQAVTSTHGGTGSVYAAGWGTGTVWGNGAPSGTASFGATVSLECASCHNPHGNGQYRILQTKPTFSGDALVAGTFTTSANAVEVKDTTSTGTHNYTIKPASDGADANGSAANIVTGANGDYWRYHWDPTGSLAWNLVTGGPSADPMNTGWNGTSPTNAAANAGVAPANNTGLMTAWCIQCHTRYSGLLSATGSPSSLTDTSGGDAVFMYKHGTTRVGCEQCHVSHGSNALMTGSNTLNYTTPSGQVLPKVTDAGAAGNVTSGDSRLLKVDNRGTCQLCHDPTGTIPVPAAGTPGVYIGPLPTPGN